MAIDKNSKAYQNLVKSGYTDEQITQMHSDLSSGQTAKEVVANTQPTPSSTPTAPTTTPTETPTTPTVEDTTVKQEEKVVSTVPEIKQEGALKPLSEEYYQQDTQEAQDKIVANLNNYKQSNPEYFSDYDSFKKNFSYDARSDQQKNTLDQWYKGYTTGLQLSNVPTNDLYTQYKDGQLSNADMESLRIANPTKYTELQNQINKGTIIAAYDDSTAPETMNFQEIAYKMIAESLNRMGSGDYGTSQFFDDYEKKMNSPEMLELSDKTTALQEDITNIQDDIESMRKQVEKEYEGKGASRAKINAIVADRTYDLQLQLRTLNNEYTKYATDYNNRANQYQNEFNLQLQEYQLNMQARNQQMNELGFAMDLMNFETNDQKQEREWNYWVKQQEYQNGNINSSDYQTRYKAALKSVENLLAQYPNIPMQRSAEQMAEDILTSMDQNGTSLGDELTKINKFIQQKPEYKYLYNNTYGTKKAEGITGSYNIGGTEYVIYNGELMTATAFNKKYGGAVSSGGAKPYDAVDEKVFSTAPVDYGYNTLGSFLLSKEGKVKGGQCGKFVNDYLEHIGMERYYDNDLSTKLNSVNSYTPKVGTIAVFDYGHKSSDGINYGHVGIVTKVNPDGSFEVTDSNFGSDEKIQTRTIRPGSTSLKGFFDPSQGASSTLDTGNTTNTTLSSVDLAKKENYLEEARRGRISQTNTVQIGDLAAEQGWGDEWREALNAGLKVNLTDTQTKMMNSTDSTFASNAIVKEFESAINQMQQLQVALNDTSGVGDMSAIFTFMKTLDPSSVVRESEFNSAAATAGVLNPSAIFQSLERSVDGKFLTPKQREDFKKIAVEFIKVKAKNYQTKYDDLLKRYDYYGIDRDLAPTNMAQQILDSLQVTSAPTQYQSTTSWTPSWLTNSNLTYTGVGTTVNVGGYNVPSQF